MVCAYMPDGCVWNGIKNVLPDSYIETISVGDVLDDDTINPCAAPTDRSGCCLLSPRRCLSQTDLAPRSVAAAGAGHAARAGGAEDPARARGVCFESQDVIVNT